jgi:hypothetical protein
VNSTKHIKLVKSKEVEFRRRQLLAKKVFAIRFWKNRIETTKFCRTREEALVNKLNKRKKRACLRGFRDQFKNVSELTKNLSNLEKMMRNKILADSFK